MFKKILNLLLIAGVLYVVVSSFVHHDRFHSMIFHFRTAESAVTASPAQVPSAPDEEVERPVADSAAYAPAPVADSSAMGQPAQPAADTTARRP